MLLKLGNFGVFGASVTIAVDLVLLHAPTESLVDATANTEDREGLGYLGIVPEILLWIKAGFVHLHGSLLIKPVDRD
jgi:hypothetical protein